MWLLIIIVSTSALILTQELNFIVPQTEISPSSLNNVLEHCLHYENCFSCTQQKQNTSCGWCSPLDKCTLATDCQNTENVTHFIDNSKKCPFIYKIESGVADFGDGINVYIANYPLYCNRYVCHYTSMWNSSNAIFMRSDRRLESLKCPLPPRKLLGVPSEMNSYQLELSIRTDTASSRDFTPKVKLTIYDCKSFYSCSDCMKSKFSCKWCFKENVCAHFNDTCVDDEVLKPFVDSMDNRCV